MEEIIWEPTWMRVPAWSLPSWVESPLVFQGLRRVGHECWDGERGEAAWRTSVWLPVEGWVFMQAVKVRNRKKEGLTAGYGWGIENTARTRGQGWLGKNFTAAALKTF